MRLIAAIILSLTLSGCLVTENSFNALPPGTWRGVLKLHGNPIVQPIEKKGYTLEEIIPEELPFNFEVVYTSPDSFYLEIINGEERIRADKIYYGRDRSTAKDTLRVAFPVYDSYIKAIFQEDILQGEWVVNYRENYSIPFTAKFGEGYRFTELRKPPAMDISGKWAVVFDEPGGEPYPAIGEFAQNGNYLTGTFLTETGDYRFLEGTVQADHFYLSCFDGSHAFLFEGKIMPDSTLIGSFLSGKHYRTTWTGRKDPQARLAHPDSLTNATAPRMAFSFENPEGEMVSIDDPAYQNKVKIVQIMGSWCPNCFDETEFLKNYLKQNPSEDIEVIALSFERYPDRERSMEAIKRFRENMNVSWEVLWAGNSKRDEASRALPMIDGIKSYPTMIFVDRQNRIRRIHTGFSGPATSEFANFQSEFHLFVQELLAENGQ